MAGYSIVIVTLLQVTFTVQQKEFKFPSEVRALIGSCVEIPCTVNTSGTEPRNAAVVWHTVRASHISRIVYSTNTFEIASDYKKRATLIGNPEDSCTLRIHKVTKKDEKGYYPSDRRLRSVVSSVSDYVQLRVIDAPSQPVLSVPEKIIIGEPTMITCFVEHTCATSPPSLDWNFPDLPVTKKNIDIGKGKWLSTSELTYLPFGEHNGSNIVCMATFPNGQTSQASAKLNVLEKQHREHEMGNNLKNSTVEKIFSRNIRTLIVAACFIPVLLIAFFMWRFLLGRNSNKSRAFYLCERKKDSSKSKDTKDTGYTDLMEREKAPYCVLKQKNQGEAHLKPTENLNIYTNIYETLT